MLLKHYLDQGVSKSKLSRRFGISRRTIHSWIESGQLDRDLSSGETSYTPRTSLLTKRANTAVNQPPHEVQQDDVGQGQG